MTIKEAAEKTGVSIDNLRYYERIGLIPPIPRNKSGIREYDERALQWINFVLKFKKAGASLEEIIEYVNLAQSDDNTKEARRKILLDIKCKLQEKIDKLNECMDTINYKIENYNDLCDPITQEIINKWKIEQSK